MLPLRGSGARSSRACSTSTPRQGSAKIIPPDSFAPPTEGCPCPFSLSSFQAIKTLGLLSNYYYFLTPSARVQGVPSWIRASNDSKTTPPGGNAVSMYTFGLCISIVFSLRHKAFCPFMVSYLCYTENHFIFDVKGWVVMLSFPESGQNVEYFVHVNVWASNTHLVYCNDIVGSHSEQPHVWWPAN